MPAKGTIQRALIAIGLPLLALALWDAAKGGFYYTPFGIRLSSQQAQRPFLLGAIAMIAAFWIHERTAQPDATSWQTSNRWAPWIAASVAIASVAAGVHFGIFAAGGADAYGYVSQAALWASGDLAAPDPLAALEARLGPAVAPLGYQLARVPGAIVPIYSPGLPLAMALASTIGGPSGVYYVVPMLGGLAVWLTYLIGARVDRPMTGMIAAVLLAFSPIFVFQTFEPMSDVPATTWWLMAWVFALSPAPWSPLGAGLAVSAAVLTRPNLVPLALIVAAVTLGFQLRFRRLALFAIGSIPGCVIIAAINARLYGSPLASGYGPFNSLYGWDRWRDNLHHYVAWLSELHSPGIFLAFAAPFVVRTRTTLAMLLFFGALLVCYLFYIVHDSWPFLRFLLPAIPLLLILTSVVMVRAIEWLPVRLRTVAVFLFCTFTTVWFERKADALGVFAIQHAERRYVTVGEFVGRTLPANAVVISLLESGSVRLYGARPTLRWDLLKAPDFDGSIELLQTSGYAPYILLEEWEQDSFRTRFGASRYGKVGWPPAFEFEGTSRARIYDVADLARHLSGERILTRPIRER